MTDPSLRDGVEAFLGLTFQEPEKPYRTQREMHQEAMRVVGFCQAQEQLRSILQQCGEGELAKTRTDGQLRPMQGPGSLNLWVPPEWPVRRR